MNRLSHATGSSRNRIRPRTTVLGGATLGLIAGAAVYGVVSSGSVTASSPAPFKPALVSATSAPAAAPAPAPCARKQKLERGVCIVHVQRTVVVAAPRSGTSVSSGSNQGSDPSSTGQPAAKGADREAASRSQEATGHDQEAKHTQEAEPAQEPEPAQEGAKPAEAGAKSAAAGTQPAESEAGQP